MTKDKSDLISAALDASVAVIAYCCLFYIAGWVCWEATVLFLPVMVYTVKIWHHWTRRA